MLSCRVWLKKDEVKNMKEIIARITEIVYEFGMDVDGDFIYVVDTRTHKTKSICINLAAICRAYNSKEESVDKNDIYDICTPNACKRLFNLIDEGLIVLIGRNIKLSLSSGGKTKKEETPMVSTTPNVDENGISIKKCYSFNIMETGADSIDRKGLFDVFHNILVGMQKYKGCDDYTNNKILLNRDECVIIVDDDVSHSAKLCVFTMNYLITKFILLKDVLGSKEFIENFKLKEGMNEVMLYRVFNKKYINPMAVLLSLAL